MAKRQIIKAKGSIRRKAEQADNHIIRLKGGKGGLVEATSKMDIYEFRVFGTMLTMIRKEDDDFCDYVITVSDVIKLFAIKKKGEVYEGIRNAAQRLMDRKFEIYEVKDNQQVKTTIHLLDESSEPVAAKNPNQIWVRFNAKLKPYLLELKSEYLTVDLRKVIQMQSPYDIKMYMILLHQYRLGNDAPEYELSRLKQILGLETDSYTHYGSFKQAIITRAIRNISTLTDLEIYDFLEIKQNKSVYKVGFRIRAKPNSKIDVTVEDTQAEDVTEDPTPLPLPAAEYNVNEETLADLYTQVKKYKISKRTLRAWLETFPESQVKLGIQYVLDRIAAGHKIPLVAGYIQRMVSTPDLMEAFEEEQRMVEVTKEKQVKLQKQVHQNVQAERNRDQLLETYYQERSALIASFIANSPQLATNYLQALADGSLDQPGFVKSMARDQYREFAGKGSFEEAYHQAGALFQNSVMDYCEQLFPEAFVALKEKFMAKARELSIALSI